jgi:hypothetical protein
MLHGFLRRTDVFPQAAQTISWIGQQVRAMLGVASR